MLFMLLLQRLGLIMVLAFLLVNNRFFRQLIQERSNREKAILILIFAIFVVVANLTGIEITGNEKLIERPFLPVISHTDSLANTRTLIITAASLVGGPFVGTCVGLIGGLHRYIQGNFSDAFYILGCAVVGLVIGKIADRIKGRKLFPDNKEIALLGVCAELIQMTFIGFFNGWSLVRLIIIPMVLLNSIGVTIFMSILKTYLSNERQLRAVQTKDVLELTNATLPYLRQGLNPQSAQKVCEIIMAHTNFDAVGLTDTVNVLAHIGVGSDHHIAGQAVITDLSKQAIASGKKQIAYTKEQIACPNDDCPLQAAIVVPLKINERTIGALKMYLTNPEKLMQVEENLADGLAQIFSGQLAIGIAEEQTKLANNAEIRALQAQINPHFFFNTINTISALMWFDVDKARQALLELSNFFRTSLKGGQEKEISLEQEKSHVDSFMSIENLRFPDRYQLSYHIAMPMTVKLPPFCLQVMVENAIKHAFKERKKDNRIKIEITPLADEELYVIRVSDNGSGIEKAVLERLGREIITESSGTGSALVNLNLRLTGLYGSQSQLRFTTSEQGTTVETRIPFKEVNG